LRMSTPTDVRSYGGLVGPGDLADRELLLVRGGQVDVVGPDTGGDRSLEFVGFVADEIAGQVARLEGSGEEDMSSSQSVYRKTVPIETISDLCI